MTPLPSQSYKKVLASRSKASVQLFCTAPPPDSTPQVPLHGVAPMHNTARLVNKPQAGGVGCAPVRQVVGSCFVTGQGCVL